MSLGSMKFEVNSDTGFVTVGYGAGSSPTFTRVLVGNGTAAAPSYSFTNDSNTGFYIVPAAPDILYFTAAGTNALRFSGVSGNGYVYSGASNANIGLLAAGGITLSADGTNQNIVLSPTGTGGVYVSIPGGSVVGFTASAWPTIAGYNSALSAYTRLVLNPSTDSVLFGTYTDSSNGKIQLANHTTIAGGIGFGTDTSLYRAAAGALLLTDGTVTGLFWARTANSALEIGPQSNHSLILRTNNTVALTLDTSQNATFSKDVVLGFNGPSVPSTLSGRAPRQGLVFDGTTNATMTLGSAIGTGNFTVVVWVNPNATAGTQLLIGDSSGNGSMSLIGANLRWFDLTGGSKTFTSTVTAGKMSMVTIVRSGTTLTSYANAIAGDTHTSAHNLSGTSWVIGGYGGGDKTTGIVGGPTIYNRALTQDELRKLYENGAPDSTDICAAGSQLLTGNNSTFATGQGTWQGINGGSVSAGSGVLTITTTGAYVGGGTENGLVKKGVRYRLVFTLGSYTGALNAVMPFVNTGAILGTGAYSAGTYTIDFTAAVTSYIGFSTANGNTGTFTIDNVTLVPFGAVLAPDAAQTGGGLTWYDTSGNGRTITLPATGVSWNVPTSGQVMFGNGTTTAPSLALANDTDTGFFLYGANQLGFASNGDWSLILTPGGTIYGRQGNNRLSMPLAGGVDLVAGGSNQNISLSPSGNGWVAVPNNNNLQLGLTFGQAVSNASNYFNSGNGAGWVMHFTTGSASYNASNVRLTITDSNLWTPSNINLLLGTNVDSSNGRLQLATHTTIAGGIGFGTDLAIFRSGAGTFYFQTTAGNIAILLGDTGYTMQLGSRMVSSNGELTVQTSNANSLFLKTGGVTALTIDSSLNSTFAGTAITLASATAKAGLRLPHGAAPTAPVNGDIWTTTAGLYVRINGVTVGPLT